MSLILALAAGLLWGSADYGGGRLARRLPAITVVFVSQATALLALGVLAVARGEAGLPVGGYLLFGVAAGVVGSTALVAFYRALAAGPMGLVAPLAAAGVVIPVTVGVLRGDRLTAFQGAGIALAVGGAILASGPDLRSGVPVRRRTVLLAATAAVGFGAVLPLIAEGARTSVLGTLVVQRSANVIVMGAILLVLGLRAAVDRAALPALVCVGLADVTANGAYALATRSGLVSVVSVLASLYPIWTALLARYLLGERLRPIQTAGVGAALGGVLLVAT
jgi:drug/metabolite transporter (DMT)-like permease